MAAAAGGAAAAASKRHSFSSLVLPQPFLAACRRLRRKEGTEREGEGGSEREG